MVLQIILIHPALQFTMQTTHPQSAKNVFPKKSTTEAFFPIGHSNFEDELPAHFGFSASNLVLKLIVKLRGPHQGLLRLGVAPHSKLLEGGIVRPTVQILWLQDHSVAVEHQCFQPRPTLHPLPPRGIPIPIPSGQEETRLARNQIVGYKRGAIGGGGGGGG